MSGVPDLVRLYLSGEVRRWHANPAMAGCVQTDADHQGRSAQLLVALFPQASPALIRAVLMHDVGELVAGDVPKTCKAGHPALKAALDAVEDAARAEIAGELPWLTEEERQIAKFIDRLEAYCFVALHKPAELFRSGSGWDKDRAFLIGEAIRLKAAPALGMIAALEGGNW